MEPSKNFIIFYIYGKFKNLKKIHVYYGSVKCTKNTQKVFQFYHLKADYHVFHNLLKKIYYKIVFIKMAAIATTVLVTV